MRYLLSLVFLLSAYFGAVGQSVYPIRADSVVIYKQGGYAELVLRNRTKDSINGVLVNMGNGVTSFLRFRVSNDSVYLGNTFVFTQGSGGGGGPDSSVITRPGNGLIKQVSGTDRVLYVDSTFYVTLGRAKKTQDSINTALTGKVPTTRTLTINGVSQDLSANRTWVIPADTTGFYDIVQAIIDGMTGVVFRNASGTGDSILVDTNDSTKTFKRIEVVSGTNVTVTPTITADKISYSVAASGGGGSLLNIGTGTRLAVDGTSNVKKIGTPASVTTDSTTTANVIALKLQGDEAIPNRWEFYGTNLRDSSKGFREIEENFFGKIYDSTTWNNLSSFNNRDNGFSVVSNKILADAGSPGTFTNTLDLKSSTKLNKWVYSIKIKAGVVDASNFGIGIGVRSNNDYGSYGFCGRIDLGTSSIQGQVRLNLGSSYAEAAASSGGFSISANDYVLLTVELDNYTATVKARNITTNSGYVTASYKYVTSAGADPYFANTGNFSIFRFGGSNTIDSISITSNDPKNARIMIIGDSKTQGYDVTDFGYRFGDLLNNVFKSTVIHAGGSDRTKEVSRAMPEILALRPQQVLLNIGSNDLRQGAEINSVIFARYDSITNALNAANIDVYHIVMYETAANLAPLVAHIQANYASKYIDVYNAMAAYPVATMLYADGVHPIDSGNIIAKNVIVNSYKVYGGSDRFTSGATIGSISGSGTLNTIPIFTGASEIGNSPITVTPSTRINLALPQEQIGTSPDYVWNKTNGSSNQKIWTWYGANDGKLDLRLVDDARSTVVSMLEFSRSGTTATRIDFKVPDSRFLGAAKIGTTINATEEPVAIGLLYATHFPYISMYNSFAGTDVKVYDQYVADDGVLHYRLLNDAASGGGDWMSVSRTGTSAADVAFPLVQSATDTTTYKPFGISSAGVTKRMASWNPAGSGGTTYNWRTNGKTTGDTVNVMSGTYTPTLTAGTNVSSVGSSGAIWSRSGDVITVSGYAGCTPTVISTGSTFSISLPLVGQGANIIASGTATSFAALQEPAAIGDNSTLNTVSLTFVSTGTTLRSFRFIFQYNVK